MKRLLSLEARIFPVTDARSDIMWRHSTRSGLCWRITVTFYSLASECSRPVIVNIIGGLVIWIVTLPVVSALPVARRLNLSISSKALGSVPSARHLLQYVQRDTQFKFQLHRGSSHYSTRPRGRSRWNTWKGHDIPDWRVSPPYSRFWHGGHWYVGQRGRSVCVASERLNVQFLWHGMKR